MKVAILGANGFLGKFITSQLQNKGYEVYPVTRADVDLTNFVSVTRWLETVEPYAIINCATAPAIGVDVCSYDDIQNNLNIFLNFYNNGQNFTKFINVGSGAEFDRRYDINCANEYNVLVAHPRDSYGYSKNVMSRLAMRHEKFYTLRLFGCFHPTEPEFRLFNRVARGEEVKVVDRQFDYFSARDFLVVLEHYLNKKVYFKDVNCVYEEKLYLSQVLNKIRPVEVVGENPLNYTGNGRTLAGLHLPLLGLD
jgi:dTDP-4-dehydrorhamnose reductase